jgi:uroporphyrinogen decarboxylase
MSIIKESVEKALRREATESVPVGIFLGGSWPVINSGITLESLVGDPVKTAKIFFEVNRRLDADLIMIGAGATAILIKALGGKIKFRGKGAPDIIGCPIENEDDLNGLEVEKAFKDSDVKWIIDTAKHVVSLNNNERMILASGRAPFTLAAQIYGLEKTCKAIYKNKKFIHELLEKATELSITYFKKMILEGKVHGAFIADPSASGDVLSKRHFEELVLPYTKRVVSAIKELGKPSVLHICGDITDRLHLISDTLVDCISLDSKVDMNNAKKIIGNKICLAGNVCPTEVLEFGSSQEVWEATKECLNKGARKGGFILMPGCDLAGGVPEKNIRTFVETAHNWKKELAV